MLIHRFEFVLVLCMASFLANAQEPLWLKHYGNNSQNRGLSLAYDGQGAIYGIGTLGGATNLGDTSVSILGAQDIFIARWDTAGNLNWARTAGGTCQPGDSENGAFVHYDNVSEHLLVNGQFTCPGTLFGSHTLNGSGPLSGISDSFVAAYSTSGQCLWANQISCFGIMSLGRMVTDNDGSIFLSGYSRDWPVSFQGPSPASVPAGGFIAKYGSGGDFLYAERIITNATLSVTNWIGPTEWLIYGQAKPGAELYGQSLSAAAVMGEGYVARTDMTGNVQWITMLPATESAAVARIVVLANGSYAVCGYFRGDLILADDTLFGASSAYNSFLGLLNDQGEIQWAIPFTSDGDSWLYDLGQDTQGDILAYGQFEGNLQIGHSSVPRYGSRSGIIARFSTGGELKATIAYGRRSHIPVGGSILATDHGIYLSSEFDSTLTLGSTVVQGPTDEFKRDLFLARFDSLSGFTNVPTAMAPEGGGLVIYANPNEGRCTVELPKGIAPGSVLRLVVRDAQGQLVQEEPFVVSARGTVQLDISAQARGVYHVELLDERRRYTGKVVFE